MTTTVLQFGTQLAADVRDSSTNCTGTGDMPNLATLTDLMDRLAQKDPSKMRMLPTTCARLADYLAMPIDQITIDSVYENKDGFRPFLETRKYKENAIRSYVNYVRILIKSANEFGWKPTDAVPDEWRGVLALATEGKFEEIAKYLARIRKTPRDVSIEDVDLWAQMRVRQGLSYGFAGKKKTMFWRLLRDCGCTEQAPMCLVRAKRYGVPFENFPPGLKKDVFELLRWKSAVYSLGRPQDGRHRPVTSKKLRNLFCGLLGFAVNIRGESELSSLTDLVQSQIVSGYVEWALNERQMKGAGVQSNLGLLSAALHQHPSYASYDWSWIKPLIDGIPLEPKSELKKRKALKCLQYSEVETIPSKIHAERPSATKKGACLAASLVMQELLMKWLVVLPWRQRNIRECRIDGLKPNLFKGKIPPFSDIDRPEWVKEEELKNPEAEFWQFRFNTIETKTGNDVHAILPRQLIGLLEGYLNEFRPHLLHGRAPATLFVNQTGNPMSLGQMTAIVTNLTLRHGGRRVSPHLFRDIVAFAWLKAHPKDYLTLSKLLWHSNINTTIQIYGSQFNESTGVCAMESWLEEREAKSK